MPIVINKDALSIEQKAETEAKIQEEVTRYLKYTDKDELNFVLLRSFIYVEELLNNINYKLHGIDTDRTMLGKNIELFSLIKGTDTVDMSLKLLRDIKKSRNSIAHDLEYDILSDIELITKFRKHYLDNYKETGLIKISELEDESKTMSTLGYKYLITMYFKDLIHGILYVKLGLDTIPNFISYTKD